MATRRGRTEKKPETVDEVTNEDGRETDEVKSTNTTKTLFLNRRCWFGMHPANAAGVSFTVTPLGIQRAVSALLHGKVWFWEQACLWADVAL